MKDLFKNIAKTPKKFPKGLVSIIDEMDKNYIKGRLDYKLLDYYLTQVRTYGYYFEYGLDAEPFNLIKLPEIQTVVNRDIELNIVKLKKYGIYVIYTETTNNLLTVPMLKDGSPELEFFNDILTLNAIEITAPESQEFLDYINIIFRTTFKMSDFAGR